MIIKIESFSAEKKHLLKEAFRIRSSVFVNELGISKYTEYDGLDDNAVHYLLFYNDKAVATIRWRETDAGIVLEKLAVLLKFRNRALATLLFRFVTEELLLSKKTIYLYVKENGAGFFNKNGFAKDEGNVAQAGLDICKMTFQKKIK